MLICFGAAAQPNAGQARSPQERAHHHKFADSNKRFDSNKPAHPNKCADPNRLAQHNKLLARVEMRMFFDHAAPIWNSTRRFPQPV
jgi:hypothetical protein